MFRKLFLILIYHHALKIQNDSSFLLQNTLIIYMYIGLDFSANNSVVHLKLMEMLEFFNILLVYPSTGFGLTGRHRNNA